MGFILGLLRRLIKFVFYFGLFAVIITVIPNLPPYAKFSSVELEPTLPRTGPLAPNGALNNAQKLYKNKLLGPEAFELYNGEVYTSLASGEVVKLSPGGHVTFVTKIGKPCQGLSQEHICGRPLGLAIDEKSGDLYVADSYYGIWKVNLKTDKKEQLIPPDVEIEGRKPMLFNSIALAKNGDFYWTDSSSDFNLKDGAKSLMVDPSGRLFYYNAAKKQSQVLLDNLWFANGVVVSPDNQFVVVAETNRFRLIKYYINGPKKGESEVFLSGLPGTPDNLRALPDGSGIQVGLYVTFDDENPLLSRTMAQTPHVRKFLVRILTLAEMPFEFLNKQFPNVVFEEIAYTLGSFKSLSGFLPKMSGILQADWSGNVVASYYNTDGSLCHISDAIVYQDKLLTGTPHSQDYVGAVPAPPLLKKAYESKQATPAPKTAQTVTEKIPKAEQAKKQENVKREAPEVTQPPPAKQPERVKTTTPKPEPPTTKAPPPAPKKVNAEPTKPSPVKEHDRVKFVPTTTPSPPKREAPKQAPTKTADKPTQAPPKSGDKPTQPPPKTADKPAQTPPKTPDAPKIQPKQKQEEKPGKPAKDNIPITEEIPSDTRKPNKETLKVIKKGGPTEIPNPEL